MSETLQGSKSSLYTKDPVPGVSDSIDSFSHVSVQNLWSGRGALDTINHGVFVDNAVALLIESGSVKRKIKITGHNAVAGDFIRMNTGNARHEEVSIIKVIDADWIVIAKEVNAAVGDEVFILKPVTPTYAQDGSLYVSSAPIQYILDTVATTVTKDSAVKANTRALPVEIVGADGTQMNINVTTGDVNVQLTDVGVNYDSVRIGDGTKLAAVSATNELKTYLGSEIPTGTKTIGLVKLDTAGNTIKIDQLTVDANKVIATQSTASDLKAQISGDTAIGASVPTDAVAIGVKDNAGKLQHLTLDASGNVPVTTISGFATSTNITGGDQKSQIVDGSGNVISSTTNALDVNLKSGSIANTAFDANLKSVTKGTSTAAGITSTSIDSDHQALDVNISKSIMLKNQEYSANGTNLFSTSTGNTNAQLNLPTSANTLYMKDTSAFMLGWDGTDRYRSLLLDTTGKAQVTLPDITGTKAAGTAATSSVLVGAVYTAAGITLTNGQQAALQTDADGSLRVNVIDPARKTGTITQVQKSVGVTAVRATVSGSAPTAGARKKLFLKPSKANTGAIYFGASTVTTANGMEIVGPDRLEFEFDDSDYYLISDTAAQVVEIVEVI